MKNQIFFKSEEYPEFKTDSNLENRCTQIEKSENQQRLMIKIRALQRKRDGVVAKWEEEERRVGNCRERKTSDFIRKFRN